MFYFDKQNPDVTFGDNRLESHTLCDGRLLEVQPEKVMDFRDLPYPDRAFKVVVFDPPHLVNVGPKAYLRLKYGSLSPHTWQHDLERGFAECFRVLEPNGILIFKWSSVQIPVAQILELTPMRPLIGHRSGKANNTHWITFMKPGDSQ